jgi:hypothetical protein
MDVRHNERKVNIKGNELFGSTKDWFTWNIYKEYKNT